MITKPYSKHVDHAAVSFVPAVRQEELIAAAMDVLEQDGTGYTLTHEVSKYDDRYELWHNGERINIFLMDEYLASNIASSISNRSKQ